MLAEKAARIFLWQGNDHGMHYVNWNTVCRPKAVGGLGVHGLKRWRPALLSRNAFRLLSNENFLLKDCIVSRYGPKLGCAGFRKADSPMWKLLCWGYDELAKSLTWEIGSGARISGCTDRWIHGLSLDKWPTFLNCEEEFPNNISNLFTEDGQWDNGKLQTLCGSALVEHISNVPLRGSSNQDIAVLCNRFNGCSVSSFIYSRSWDDEYWEYNWIWKLRLKPKEILFWWRICHDAIPTYTWLCRRGIPIDNMCPWGCQVPEDTAHLLLHCSFLREVCMVLGTWGLSPPLFNSMPQLFAWLRDCVEGRKYNFYGSFYCSIVYQSWMNRLAKTHNRPFATPKVAATLFLGNISCGISSPIRFWNTTVLPDDNNPNCWCPPPYGWLKANFDGALFPNGQGGCAMIVRDHLGRLVVAIGSPITHWDSGVVELQSFLLIKDILQQRLLDAVGMVIEGDNVNVIRHIKAMHNAAKACTRMQEAHPFSFLLNIHNVIIKHVLREYNKCADYAAHFAVHSHFLWEDASMAPSSFCSLLFQERSFVTS